MIYSNACSYAIRAMTRLALVRPEGYVLLDELCEDAELPRHFVAKIFQQLVRRGLLLSAKGRGGGFALARPADQITLQDIVAVIDGIDQFDRCVVGMANCDDHQPCPQHDEFKVIREHIRSFLHETTLARMSRTLERKLDLVGKKVAPPRSKSKPVARK
jgi:Rrf2 family protein